MADSPPGLLVTGSGPTFWAWGGASVDYASDLTGDRTYAAENEATRLRKALAEQQAWLGGLVGERAATFDARWLWRPEDGRLRLSLLFRVQRETADDALRAADALRARLLGAPSHVGTSPLSEADLRAALLPFAIHPDGSAEIRKRIAVARPQRPDAHMRLYWLAHPFHVAPHDWGPLLQQIAGLRQPLLISVALEPIAADAHFSAELDRIGTVFGRLAREGELHTSGIYSGPRKLAPDAFAVDAQKVYSDQARRYRDRLLRYRIAVASPSPIDDGFLHLVGATLSPADERSGETFLTREVAGDAHRVVRPSPADRALFEQNLAVLGTERWGAASVPEPFGPVALSADCVDVGEASALFRLPIATQGVLPGFPVRRPSFAVRVEIDTAGSTLEIGEQVVGGDAQGLVAIPVDDLTMHGFIVGTTGSGKTSTVLKLCDELWRTHHIPFLVIEPVNTTGDDYRWFLERAGFEDSLVLTAGDDGVAPLRLNPFEVPPGVRVGEHVANLLACFDAAFGLWDPLPAIYRMALQQTYLEAGWSIDDVGAPDADWPTLEDFIDEMFHATEDLDYEGEVRSNIVAASRVRVEQLRTGPVRSVFDCRRSTPLSELLDRPAVIELGRVGAGNEQELALVIAVLLTAIAEGRRSRPPSRQLTHLLVVEEAHKLLRRPQPSGGETKGDAAGASAKLFAGLLAEIRKYGQGILIADQDPAKLVEDAYKNTNLKIMHRLPHEDDRKLVGASMRFDADHLREAGTLARHHAFVYAEGFDRPALVRVANIRAGDPRELSDDASIRERFGAARRVSGAVDASVAPYAECDGCTAACLHRSRAAAAAATRAASSAFGELMDRWDPGCDEAERGAWWGELDAFLASLGRGRGAEAPGRELEGCLFLHLLRARYRTDRMPWLARWRSRHGSAAADATQMDTRTD